MQYYLTHEVNCRLCFVESCGGHVNVQHHLPLAGPDRLVETKPDLSSSTKRVVVSIWAAEEGPSHWGVGHTGQVSHHYV